MKQAVTMQDLGAAIRQRRKEVGLTIELLAAMLPCSPRLLGELERGQRSANVALVLKILEYLGLELMLCPKEERSPYPGTVPTTPSPWKP